MLHDTPGAAFPRRDHPVRTLFAIIQIVLGALLILVVMLQNRGSGLGAAFGGGGEIYQTKRGAEKVIFIATIVIAILFVATAIVNILLER